MALTRKLRHSSAGRRIASCNTTLKRVPDHSSQLQPARQVRDTRARNHPTGSRPKRPIPPKSPSPQNPFTIILRNNPPVFNVLPKPPPFLRPGPPLQYQADAAPQPYEPETDHSPTRGRARTQAPLQAQTPHPPPSRHESHHRLRPRRPSLSRGFRRPPNPSPIHPRSLQRQIRH